MGAGGVVRAYASGGVDVRLCQAVAEAVSADNVLLVIARTLRKQPVEHCQVGGFGEVMAPCRA